MAGLHPEVGGGRLLLRSAIPMRLRSEIIGALNVFRVRPGALSDEDMKLARALADVATVGLLQERTIRARDLVAEQLQGALNSRILIEQAKGVMAERTGLDVDQAFTVIRAHARQHGRPLMAVAVEVINGRVRLSRPQGALRERGDVGAAAVGGLI